MNPNQQGPISINIDPSQTEGIICPKCNSEFYMPMFMLRKVSAIISPSGQEEVIQVPVMVCGGCGLPFQGTNTQEEKSSIVGTDGAPIGEKTE